MIIRSKLTPGLLKSIKQGDINLKELLKYLDDCRKVTIDNNYGLWIGYEDLIKFLKGKDE